MVRAFLRVFVTLLSLLALGFIVLPAWACGPVVASSTYAATSYCQTQQSYVAPVATVYAYPLAILTVPAVTVPVQPVQPVQPVVPSSAPVQPQQAPAPAPGPAVQQEAYAPAAASVIVQRQVYATYAAAAPVVLNSIAYGGGYGRAFFNRGVVVNHHRQATVVVRAQRQRVGFIQRLREGRANRAVARAGRLQQRAGGRGPVVVPASATVIVR